MIRSLMVVGALLAAGPGSGAWRLCAADEPAAPVAMILTTRGTVTLERGSDKQPLRAMDLLRPGDVLQAGDGETILVLLDSGRRERLNPGGRVSVAAGGCTPETGV